jgi:hypothetical protein
VDRPEGQTSRPLLTEQDKAHITLHSMRGPDNFVTTKREWM